MFDMITDTQALVKAIEAHLKRKRISATAFGYQCMGDPAILRKLKSGRKPRASTVERIQQFMENADK